MIFGHEGLPRSGKSYEAVLHHILPALRAKRHVYVRLNGVGDSLDKIAAHLGMPEEEVRDLVHIMGDREVVDWCVCDTDNDGAISFPHIEKHALIVIDEAHEYWPTNRANLPERTANFFAKHGHISLDMVIISQDCKDLHRLIIRRMAKKNTYTKLDSLGSDQRYSVRFYAATGTGKYETVGTEVRKYDPAIWELYHGVQPGIESNEVYKGNTRTLWKTLRGPSILMALALVVGVVMLGRFFFAGGTTGETGKLKDVVASQKAAIPAIAHAPGAQPSTVVTTVAEAPKAKERLPAGVQYILDMAANARARHAGWYGHRDIVEFRASGGGQVLDRFTTEQLWALGWSVKRTEFGVLLSAKGHEIIATTWPVDPFGEQSDSTTERIRAAAGAPVTSASETQPTTAAANGSTLIAVGKRPMGTFPETPPYPASF
ncbi:TPA: zonular occludens toxin domain-containing protein [Stenotrophomonas maltophilia]|uniref:zonular occludens toxin domain-containing protein n=1 Tax=Stenotrophomonas TaxID=40323 RepID=UPI0013DBD5B1|nr:zonular occludens toxin domain-containing protein [Stenotrophomonas maltophilia]